MNERIASRIASELAETNELLRDIKRQIGEIRDSLHLRRTATASRRPAPRAETQLPRPPEHTGAAHQFSTPSLWRFK